MLPEVFMKKVIILLLSVCCLTTACASGKAVPETETAAAAASEATAAPVHISPLPAAIDIHQLDNCTVAVSLKEGDAYVDDTGAMQMKITVYACDLYDMVDIARLKEDDTIAIRRQEVIVTSLSRSESGAVLINGGMDHDGYELRTDDDGVFYEIGPSDARYWQALGETTIRVSPDFTFTDSSDPGNGEVTYYPGDFLVEGTGIDYSFTPYNTTIVIENGCIIAMHRIYIP